MSTGLARTLLGVSAAALVIAILLLAGGLETAAFWIALGGGIGLTRGLGDLARSGDGSQGFRNALRIEAVGIVIGSVALGIAGVLVLTNDIQTDSGMDVLIGGIGLVGSAVGLGLIASGWKRLR